MGAAANAAQAQLHALAGTRAAGKAVSAATSRARTPLIAGGAALAGLAGGLALINRARNGSGLGRRSSKDGAFDLDSIASAAKRLSSFGDQVGVIASAVQGLSEGSKK